MHSFSLKYQTAENVPAPFAHAIEINGEIVQNQAGNNPLGGTPQLSFSFELTYLDRNELTEEDLAEEGFTLNDDFSWKGTLPKIWANIVFGNLKSAKVLYIKELEPHQEFWEIDFDGKTFYPKDTEQFKYLIEELQQAVFEKAKREAPLKLTYLKNQAGENFEVIIIASFVERNVSFQKINFNEVQDDTKMVAWEELNFILKNTFSGDFVDEFALKNRPAHKGLFLNIGTELWYEVGKSYMIQPNKIHKILKM